MGHPRLPTADDEATYVVCRRPSGVFDGGCGEEWSRRRARRTRRCYQRCPMPCKMSVIDAGIDDDNIRHLLISVRRLFTDCQIDTLMIRLTDQLIVQLLNGSMCVELQETQIAVLWPSERLQLYR